MGEEHSSTGLGLILLQPFPISHHSSHKLLAPGERAAPPGFGVKYCFGGDPVRGTWGERRFGQSDQAVYVASGKVVDVTKLLLPSMPDLL